MPQVQESSESSRNESAASESAHIKASLGTFRFIKNERRAHGSIQVRLLNQNSMPVEKYNSNYSSAVKARSSIVVQ